MVSVDVKHLWLTLRRLPTSFPGQVQTTFPPSGARYVPVARLRGKGTVQHVKFCSHPADLSVLPHNVCHHSYRWLFLPSVGAEQDSNILNQVVGRFYIALFSALEQTPCARMRFYVSEWLVFYGAFLNINRSGVLTACLGSTAVRTSSKPFRQSSVRATSPSRLTCWWKQWCPVVRRKMVVFCCRSRRWTGSFWFSGTGWDVHLMMVFTFLKEMSGCGCASDCGLCVWGGGGEGLFVFPYGALCGLFWWDRALRVYRISYLG